MKPVRIRKHLRHATQYLRRWAGSGGGASSRFPHEPDEEETRSRLPRIGDRVMINAGIVGQRGSELPGKVIRVEENEETGGYTVSVNVNRKDANFYGILNPIEFNEKDEGAYRIL